MIAEKYNTNKGSKFTVQMPKDAPFMNLKDFSEESVVVLRGVYINSKGNYGEEAVGMIDNAFVNLPKHMVDTVKNMIADGEFVDAVNAGKVGFKVRTYEDTKHGKGTCYTVEWVDL